MLDRQAVVELIEQRLGGEQNCRLLTRSLLNLKAWVTEYLCRLGYTVSLLRRSVRTVARWLVNPPFLLAVLVARLLATPAFLLASWVVPILARRGNRPGKPRLVWGSTPLINNSYWSSGMHAAGYTSETFMTNVYEVYKREDFDRVLTEEYSWAPNALKPYLAFFQALFRYDVFFLSFDGFFIGRTPFAFHQARILKRAGKKTVVIPYGSDALVYRRIRNAGTLHGLMMSYPSIARDQDRIGRNVDYWVANADAVIPTIVGPDGFGRWDALLPTALFIDLERWQPCVRNNVADGSSGIVTVTHTPNHRGFKGTEFVVEAIRRLQSEGLKVDLRLLERIPNTEVRRVLREETDILVEQLISIGHGLSGLEGMASGVPVVCNLEDATYTTPMRRWSYLDECPAVSASPETLVEVLRKLVTRPELRRMLGRASRAYVEKYHGLDSAHYLFSNVIDFVYDRRDSMINLYHPLLGEYPRRRPKIEHPLVNNRIVDA